MKIKRGIKAVLIILFLLITICFSFAYDTLYPLNYDRYSSERNNIVFRNNANLTGNLYFNVTQEIEIDTTTFRTPQVSPARENIIGYSYVYSFSGTQNEYAYASFHMPDSFLNESPIRIGIYWAADTVDPGFVRWCFDFKAINNTGRLINQTFGNYCVDQNASEIKYSSQKTYLYISNYSIHQDDIIKFRIYRDTAIDNYTHDAHLVALSLYYSAYRLGE